MTDWYCVCVTHQELEEFWPFKALLTELTRRLSYCVTAELVPLMEVAGVMEVREHRRILGASEHQRIQCVSRLI